MSCMYDVLYVYVGLYRTARTHHTCLFYRFFFTRTERLLTAAAPLPAAPVPRATAPFLPPLLFSLFEGLLQLLSPRSRPGGTRFFLLSNPTFLAWLVVLATALQTNLQ